MGTESAVGVARRLERDLSQEIVVGAFVLMVLLGIGYFTIILSRESWFKPKYEYEIRFSNVLGLREGDSVIVRGMPVGKITALKLEADGVHVSASMDQPLDLRTDYKSIVSVSSILGGRQLIIEQGRKEHKLPEGTLLNGQDPNDLMGNAADVVAAIKKSLVDGGILDDLKATSRSLREISDRLNKGEGTLGRLLSSDDTVYKDLSASVTSLRAISERLERGEGSLGKLLATDSKLYDDLSATVGSLKTVSERLEKGEGTLGKLLAPDDTLYRDVAAAAASLKAISGRIESGQGMLGRLVQDEELYNELRQVVREGRATIDDFRETAPILTFTSIFFGVF